MRKAGIKETLSHWTLPGLLRELRVGRRTGLLTFELADAKRALRFRDGSIIAAHTSLEGERLPERLVRMGLVSEGDVQEGLQVMRREAKGLGAVLVDRGLIDRAGLERAVTDEVRDILIRAFAATEGTYVFHDGEATPGEDIAVDIPTEDLIIEAIRQVGNPAIVRYALGDTNRVLMVGSGIRLDRLHLSSADGYFLSRVDGCLSGHEIIELLPFESDDAHRTLLGLVCAGIVEFEGPPKAASRLPEIATLATERAIELGLAAAPLPPAPAPERAAAAEEPSPPPVPNGPVEDDIAEETLAQADRELAAGRPADAARVLESVVGLVEGDIRRRVRRRLAEALLQEPRSQKRGEEQLLILIAESPNDAEACFALGNIYRNRGLRSRGEAMFRRVLELDPGHVGARAALPEPETPKPPAAGLLGRILRR